MNRRSFSKNFLGRLLFGDKKNQEIKNNLSEFDIIYCYQKLTCNVFAVVNQSDNQSIYNRIKYKM